MIPFVSTARICLCESGSGRDEEPAGRNPPRDLDPFSDAEFVENYANHQANSSQSQNGRCDCSARLLIILNQLRREFVQFKLRGHSLQAGSKRFDFLLLLRDSCFQLLNFTIEHGLALRALAPWFGPTSQPSSSVARSRG